MTARIAFVRFAFIKPLAPEWVPHLLRWGNVGPPTEPDQIAVPIGGPPYEGKAFGPTPTQRHLLEHYPSFLAFMEERFPGWTPARVPLGEIARCERSYAGSGVFIGNRRRADAWIRLEAIRGRVELVQHVACKAGRVIAKVTGAMDAGGELVIKRGAWPYVRTTDVDLDRVFAALDYTGFACVNLKMVGDQPKIFEINPRLGGSLVTGPDFDEIMRATVRELEGERWG